MSGEGELELTLNDQEMVDIEVQDSNIKDETQKENGETEGANDDKSNGIKNIEEIKDEHYSQSRPGEFSSENFKIEVSGLPMNYPFSQLKKLINNTLQLDAHKVKPGGFGRNVIYVNFKSEEARTKAKTILGGYIWMGSAFTAKDAKPAQDPVLLAKIDYLRVPKKEHQHLPLADRITKAVTRDHDVPYEKQIEEKEKLIRNMLRKYGSDLAQMNPELQDFVFWHKKRRKGQICEFDDMIHSPVLEAYRNKCEFTIGMNSESDNPVVGFRVASYKEGSVEVGPIGHLKHLNDKMKAAVKCMEKFLENHKHKPFDPFTHSGVWRQLCIRTSNNDDVMLIVQIHPQNLIDDQIDEIKEEFKNYFTVGDGTEANVTSLYFQRCGQLERGVEIEYEHLYGKTYIEETILGKTFRASPDAFLQVNTPACEKLYAKIAEVADIDAMSTVLDVCCGVGSIGLSLAENAYKVMGVELNEEAVKNARINAENNGITNAVFYNGKAEDYIEAMLEKSQRSKCVAIVDPPRAGLNGSVMNALRKCEYLDKIVYISCDPQMALPNFQALGRPRSKSYKGTYFVPIKATPVDLFPDTPHYELIIVFERYDECKWDRIMSGNPRPKDKEYFDRVPALQYDEEQEKKDREDRRRKREEEAAKKPRLARSRRNDRFARGGDRYDRSARDNWGGRKGRRFYDDDYDGGSGAPWGSGYGISRNSNANSNSMGEQVNMKNFGDGFQQGYQAAMAALMQQSSGGTGANNQASEDGYGGSDFNSSSNSYNSQQGRKQFKSETPITYPIANNSGGMATQNPNQGNQDFSSNQFGSSGSAWNQTQGNQGGVGQGQGNQSEWGQGQGNQGGWVQGHGSQGEWSQGQGNQGGWGQGQGDQGGWGQRQDNQSGWGSSQSGQLLGGGYNSFDDPSPKKWKNQGNTSQYSNF